MIAIKECMRDFNYENKVSFMFLCIVSIGIFAAREKYFVRYPEMVVMQEIGEYNEVHFDSSELFSDKHLYRPHLDTVAVRQDHTKRNVTKIFFLKTHKTGSSTVMNIVQRYGLKTKMRFALPKQQGQGQFTETTSINGKMVLGWDKHMHEAYELICNHLLYSSEGIHQILGSESIFKFSVVREPISQYHSVFSYYTEKVPEFQLPNMTFSATTRLKFFVETQSLWDRVAENGIMFAFNPQLSQFSELSRSPYLTDDFITDEIAKIQREFDFIIVLEYFDISLCVLRHKIGWSMEDIQYLKINSIYDKGDSGKTWLNGSLRDNFHKLNNGDIMLYNKMNRTLWQEVDRIGRSKIFEEEKELQQLNLRLERRCTNGTYKRKIWNGQQAIFPKLRASMKADQLCWGVTRQMVQFTNFLKMDYTRKYLT